MTQIDQAAYMEDIRQIVLKNRTWYIASVAILGLVWLAVFLFYRPTVKIDTALLDAKNRELAALQSQSVAFQILAEEQSMRIGALMSKDSALLTEVQATGHAIRNIKIKTNENITRFDGYGSSDWATYFSKLPEQSR